MSLMFGLTGDRDTDKELHRIADRLAELFGHSRDDAEDLVRGFYLATTRPEGALRHVTSWDDDAFWHEGTDAAFYVQYHMTQPGFRKCKTMKFLDWRKECYAAEKAGQPMPPLPPVDQP
jgi:hypothetical protein